MVKIAGKHPVIVIFICSDFHMRCFKPLPVLELGHFYGAFVPLFQKRIRTVPAFVPSFRLAIGHELNESHA